MKRTSFLKRHAFDIAVAIVFILLLAMSSCDIKAMEAERDHYCSMVKSGAWPDYRGISATECAQ